MLRVLTLALVLCLGGCGVAPHIIKSDAVSYDDVLEDTTNKLLLLNILRARDKAPLHFAEIPSIHESIQQTASLNLVDPFGPPRTSSARKTATTNLGLQMTPTFDVQRLVTRDFVSGIASPIDPKFVKYWLDRGLDRRIVLLLFFSSAEIVERDANGQTSTIRIVNAPREALDVIRGIVKPPSQSRELRCDEQSDFQRYLRLINSLSSFFANAYVERRAIAENFRLDPTHDLKLIQDMALADPRRLQWERTGDLYTLYALSPEQKVALCIGQARDVGVVQAGAPSTRDSKACYQSVIDTSNPRTGGLQPAQVPLTQERSKRESLPSEFCDKYNRFVASGGSGDNGRAELRLQTRSVGEIIQFLGDLLEYQDELERYTSAHPDLRLRLNHPVTFGYCEDEPGGGRAGCADVFFNLQRNGCNARFAVSYRGEEYTVGPYDLQSANAAAAPCVGVTGSKLAAGAKDHTLEVLSVVHQLVDLNKTAADIRTTPSVQVLP